MLSNFIHYYQLSILSNSIPYHVIELHPELHPLLSSLHTVQSNTLSCYRTSAVIINCPSCIIHYLTPLSNLQPSLSTVHPVQSNTLPCYRTSFIIINSPSCPIQYLTMLSNFIHYYQFSILSNPIPYHVIELNPLLSSLHPV